MDVDVDVDAVMLACGWEPGRGVLPGRAQPEVRHCSVTWYPQGSKLSVLGPPSHHDGWVATKVPCQVRCTAVDGPSLHVAIAAVNVVVLCRAASQIWQVYHGAHTVARADQARGPCSIPMAHGPHTHTRTQTHTAYLDCHQAASLDVQPWPAAPKHPASSWCMIFSPFWPG